MRLLLACMALATVLVACSTGSETSKSAPPSGEDRSAATTNPGDHVLEGTADHAAIPVVGKNIGANKLQVKPDQLRAVNNPKGEGTFVFVRQTRFYDVPRYVIWVVIDSQAYPLNAPAKLVTESLPWPREAPPGVWQRTNLSPYEASVALEYVFGVRH